jgi:hypothetical protein
VRAQHKLPCDLAIAETAREAGVLTASTAFNNSPADDPSFTKAGSLTETTPSASASTVPHMFALSQSRSPTMDQDTARLRTTIDGVCAKL